MSAHNLRGNWEKQIVTAAQAGGAVVGVPILEQGFFGIPEATTPQNSKYALDIGKRIYELSTSLISTAGPYTKGQTVWIPTAAPFTLQVTARGAAAPTSTIPFGRIVAVPGDGFDLNTLLPAANAVPATGFVWVALLGQGA